MELILNDKCCIYFESPKEIHKVFQSINKYKKSKSNIYFYNEQEIMDNNLITIDWKLDHEKELKLAKTSQLRKDLEPLINSESIIDNFIEKIGEPLESFKEIINQYIDIEGVDLVNKIKAPFDIFDNFISIKTSGDNYYEDFLKVYKNIIKKTNAIFLFNNPSFLSNKIEELTSELKVVYFTTDIEFAARCLKKHNLYLFTNNKLNKLDISDEKIISGLVVNEMKNNKTDIPPEVYARQIREVIFPEDIALEKQQLIEDLSLELIQIFLNRSTNIKKYSLKYQNILKQLIS